MRRIKRKNKQIDSISQLPAADPAKRAPATSIDFFLGNGTHFGEMLLVVLVLCFVVVAAVGEERLPENGYRYERPRMTFELPAYEQRSLEPTRHYLPITAVDNVDMQEAAKMQHIFQTFTDESKSSNVGIFKTYLPAQFLPSHSRENYNYKANLNQQKAKVQVAGGGISMEYLPPMSTELSNFGFQFLPASIRKDLQITSNVAYIDLKGLTGDEKAEKAQLNSELVPQTGGGDSKVRFNHQAKNFEFSSVYSPPAISTVQNIESSSGYLPPSATTETRQLEFQYLPASLGKPIQQIKNFEIKTVASTRTSTDQLVNSEQRRLINLPNKQYLPAAFFPAAFNTGNFNTNQKTAKTTTNLVAYSAPTIEPIFQRFPTPLNSERPKNNYLPSQTQQQFNLFTPPPFSSSFTSIQQQLPASFNFQPSQNIFQQNQQRYDSISDNNSSLKSNSPPASTPQYLPPQPIPQSVLTQPPSTRASFSAVQEFQQIHHDFKALPSLNFYLPALKQEGTQETSKPSGNSLQRFANIPTLNGNVEVTSSTTKTTTAQPILLTTSSQPIFQAKNPTTEAPPPVTETILKHYPSPSATVRPTKSLTKLTPNYKSVDHVKVNPPIANDDEIFIFIKKERPTAIVQTTKKPIVLAVIESTPREGPIENSGQSLPYSPTIRENCGYQFTVQTNFGATTRATTPTTTSKKPATLPPRPITLIDVDSPTSHLEGYNYELPEKPWRMEHFVVNQTTLENVGAPTSHLEGYQYERPFKEFKT